MKATKQGGWVMVSIDSDDIVTFNDSWPGSPIPDDSTLLVELDARNGDLVNITMHVDGRYVDSAEYDGDALLALCNDANNFAVGAYMLPTWAKR